jgi:hypothetical protein
MMAIPGFTAEQSLGSIRWQYLLAGTKTTRPFSRLRPMQESETGSYDDGGDQGDGGGGNGDGSGDTSGDTSGNNGSSYDAGTPMCRCNVCQDCRYIDGQGYHCNSWITTAIPCGQTCGSNSCDLR